MSDFSLTSRVYSQRKSSKVFIIFEKKSKRATNTINVCKLNVKTGFAFVFDRNCIFEKDKAKIPFYLTLRLHPHFVCYVITQIQICWYVQNREVEDRLVSPKSKKCLYTFFSMGVLRVTDHREH